MKILTIFVTIVMWGCPALAGTDVLFTTENDGRKTAIVADRIIKEFRKAKKTIDIAVAHFNYEEIAEALIDFAEDHPRVKIRILLDQDEYGSRDSQSKRLHRAGLEVRYKYYSLRHYFPYAKLMHHKFMLVDDKVLVEGSYNWSETAEHTNHENILVFWGRENTELLARYREQFDYLWDLNRDRWDEFYTRLKAKKGSPEYRRFVPIHFLPMSLSHLEVGRVYSQTRAMRFPWGNAVLANLVFDREARRGLPEYQGEYFLDPRGMIITEIRKGVKARGHSEYVEIFNLSPNPVDLTGWTITDGDEVDDFAPWEEGGSIQIPGNGYAVVYTRRKTKPTVAPGAFVLTVADERIGNGLAARDRIEIVSPDGKYVADGQTVPTGAKDGAVFGRQEARWDAKWGKLDHPSPGTDNGGWVSLDGDSDNSEE